MLQILEGSIVAGKSGKPLKVVAIDGEKVVVESGDELLRVARSAILQVLAPPKTVHPTTGQSFHIGDRVTLLDKYQVRAADIGTVEAFTALGIQVLWDNNSQHEPNLSQPPMGSRTFLADELKLIEHMYHQN
jgi:hypothetical protein